jgi:hypothetical protein
LSDEKREYFSVAFFFYYLLLFYFSLCFATATAAVAVAVVIVDEQRLLFYIMQIPQKTRRKVCRFLFFSFLLLNQTFVLICRDIEIDFHDRLDSTSLDLT